MQLDRINESSVSVVVLYKNTFQNSWPKNFYKEDEIVIACNISDYILLRSIISIVSDRKDEMTY